MIVYTSQRCNLQMTDNPIQRMTTTETGVTSNDNKKRYISMQTYKTVCVKELTTRGNIKSVPKRMTFVTVFDAVRLLLDKEC